ncbi:L-aminoadipate-semialdehyde dehydrogenase-phosphopantetheinyl transferase [Trifolium repens]|nr:L-aminoadipate-semialdehyde dehydrogenase-phosphopantetheinyl transferase [Trifolium repens]
MVSFEASCSVSDPPFNNQSLFPHGAAAIVVVFTHKLVDVLEPKRSICQTMGSGLIEGLNKVEFSHTNWTNISGTMDGKMAD